MRTPRSPATWLAATRPRFLSITVVAVLVGLASAIGSGVAPHWTSAALTLLGAVLIHAGANLVNDYHDREADAGNTERLFPFTGGSRMIQDGVFGASAIAAFGYALLAAAAALGAALALAGRPQLWALGGAGLALAIAYSAPPLRLSARGVGEPLVAAAWLLVVVGADVAQRGSWSSAPLVAGVPIALLVAAILHANGFPDHAADAAAVAQLGAVTADHGHHVGAARGPRVLHRDVEAGELAPVVAIAPLPNQFVTRLEIHGPGRI